MSKEDYRKFEMRGFEHEKLYAKYDSTTNNEKDNEKKSEEKLDTNEKNKK